MNRSDIFAAIESERDYQNKKWGSDFDAKNTPNDWVAYITQYLGAAATMPFSEVVFRNRLMKVATLCVAALEQEEYAPRHYDGV